MSQLPITVGFLCAILAVCFFVLGAIVEVWKWYKRKEEEGRVAPSWSTLELGVLACLELEDAKEALVDLAEELGVEIEDCKDWQSVAYRLDQVQRALCVKLG